MRTRWLVSAIFAVLLVGSGCKSKPTLVGEWTGNATIQSVAIDMTFTFGADGTLSVAQSANGQKSSQKGTYKEEEKSFTMTLTSVDAPGGPKAMIDGVNAELAKNPKKVTFTLEWKDADTISVTQQGAQPPLNVAFTLKRKK